MLNESDVVKMLSLLYANPNYSLSLGLYYCVFYLGYVDSGS